MADEASSAPAPSEPQAKPPPSEAAKVESKTVAEAPPSTGKPASTVTLLDAGAEPRKALRYVFHRGESLKFRMHQDMTMETALTMSGVSSLSPTRNMQQILPSTEFDGVMRTRRVDPDGSAHRDGYVGGIRLVATPGVEPELEKKMGEMFRGIGKLPFDDVINTRGEELEYHMDLSSVSDPTMLDTMKQTSEHMSALMAPWPVEPVGVGAKWQTQSTFSMSGGQFVRTSVVTLSSLRGSKAKLEMTTSVVGAPHGVLKNGVAVEIGETKTTGGAHLEITLDPMTCQSKSSSQTETDSSAETMRIHIKMNIETEFKSGV